MTITNVPNTKFAAQAQQEQPQLGRTPASVVDVVTLLKETHAMAKELTMTCLEREDKHADRMERMLQLVASPPREQPPSGLSTTPPTPGRTPSPQHRRVLTLAQERALLKREEEQRRSYR